MCIVPIAIVFLHMLLPYAWFPSFAVPVPWRIRSNNFVQLNTIKYDKNLPTYNPYMQMSDVSSTHVQNASTRCGRV